MWARKRTTEGVVSQMLQQAVQRWRRSRIPWRGHAVDELRSIKMQCSLEESKRREEKEDSSVVVNPVASGRKSKLVPAWEGFGVEALKARTASCKTMGAQIKRSSLSLSTRVETFLHDAQRVRARSRWRFIVAQGPKVEASFARRFTSSTTSSSQRWFFHRHGVLPLSPAMTHLRRIMPISPQLAVAEETGAEGVEGDPEGKQRTSQLPPGESRRSDKNPWTA